MVARNKCFTNFSRGFDDNSNVHSFISKGRVILFIVHLNEVFRSHESLYLLKDLLFSDDSFVNAQKKCLDLIDVSFLLSQTKFKEGLLPLKGIYKSRRKILLAIFQTVLWKWTKRNIQNYVLLISRLPLYGLRTVFRHSLEPMYEGSL